MEEMDHFFNSVATLMSNLARSCVERTIQDLVEWVELYDGGSAYSGDYFQSDQWLAIRPQPIQIFMVSAMHCFSVGISLKIAKQTKDHLYSVCFLGYHYLHIPLYMH